MNENMQVVNVPINEIFSDDEFNVRGYIRMADVVDLGRNIEKNGLIQPITIQSFKRGDKPGINFRVVAGHRRYAAYCYLQRDTIPAIINNNLTEIAALAMNFNENVSRQDLNILQEARGIERFLAKGESIDSIAKLIDKGRGWVNTRRLLLTMPDPIQQDAAAGWLTQAQINQLAEMDGDADDQMAIVKAIKEAKGRNEQRLPEIIKKKSNPSQRRKRNTTDILNMMDHIFDETGETSPFTRAFAWVNGEISDLDLYRDLEAFFNKNEDIYHPPLEVRHLMTIVNPEKAGVA